MSHDIESNYTEDYWNDEKQCPHCSSSDTRGEEIFCRELGQRVPKTAHCDFFQSVD